jgi:hypothetical protein
MDGGTLLAMLVPLGGTVVIAYIVAADRKRFLAQFDLPAWRDHHYLRRLPNFLQALHDNHFRSAWPRRHNAVSAGCFSQRAGKHLRNASAGVRRKFMRQHITLFGLLEVLKPYISDFLLHERQRIVSERLIGMSDTVDRDRLATYLDSIRLHRAQFYSGITAYDRRIIVTMVNRKFMPTLKIAHAVFQEHGYSLLPEFDVIRRWEGMEGADLAQELPRNMMAIKRLPAGKMKAVNYGGMSEGG